MDNIFAYIRAQRNAFEHETIEVVRGYNYSQRQTVEKTTKYWASQYETGNDDPILGKLPFDNILIEPVEKEAEATDFDNADIEIRPKTNTPEARYKTMIATKALREYLDRNHFAKTLNEICHTRALYGGVLVKDSKEGTKVVPWANVITDQSDIMSGSIIERHYYTPAELKKMTKWKNVDAAIETAHERRAYTQTGSENDTQGHLIEVYEFHGVVPRSLVEEYGDPLSFVQYMYVIAGIDWQDTDNKTGVTTENGIILYEAEEPEMPYKYNARNPIVGRGLGVGVVESLFDQQRTHNFTMSEELRTMSIAGKVFFDTDNPDVPNNVLTQINHGTVLKRKPEHSPLTQVNAVPSSLPGYQAIREEIKASSRAITGAYESVTGEEGMSNKPFRLAALQNIEGHSRYEQEREELGELIEDIITDWELPRALAWISKQDELLANFEPQELSEIDEIIKTREMTDRKVQSLLYAKKAVTPEMEQEWMMEIDKALRRGGNKRLIEDIKDFIKDVAGDVRVSTTSEGKNKQAWFESRANLIQVLDPTDPRRSALINSIMDEAGITSEELRVEEEKMMAAQTAAPAVQFNQQERVAPAIQAQQ